MFFPQSVNLELRFGASMCILCKVESQHVTGASRVDQLLTNIAGAWGYRWCCCITCHQCLSTHKHTQMCLSCLNLTYRSPGQLIVKYLQGVHFLRTFIKYLTSVIQNVLLNLTKILRRKLIDFKLFVKNMEELEEKLLVVCKVALRTIILRDNNTRKHWWTINNITYMLQLRYNKSNMTI